MENLHHVCAVTCRNKVERQVPLGRKVKGLGSHLIINVDLIRYNERWDTLAVLLKLLVPSCFVSQQAPFVFVYFVKESDSDDEH